MPEAAVSIILYPTINRLLQNSPPFVLHV